MYSLNPNFQTGQLVICNGYPGAIIREYCEGMYEVRLDRGDVCVDVSEIHPYCEVSLHRNKRVFPHASNN